MKVSVIMPAHNAGAFIGAALESVMSQTERDLELIVTDDGSSDDTGDIVRRAAEKDDRIRLLRHETARGPAAARNTAIRAAAGEWLAPLDADDEFTAERLERMVADAQGRRLDFLADNLKLIDFESGRPLGEAFPGDWMADEGLVDLGAVLTRDWPGQLSPLPFGFVQPLMRREFLLRHALSYDEKIRVGEDLLLYCEALIAGARFGMMNAAQYVYRRRSNSISRSWDANMDLCRVNDRVAAAVGGSKPEVADILRRRGHALQYEVFSYAWKRGRLPLALASGARMPLGYIVQRLCASARTRWQAAPDGQ